MLSVPKDFAISQVTEEDGRLRLIVAGELDIATSDLLDECLQMTAATRKRVILDLHQVSFIESSGLRVILAALRHAQREGWGLTLTESTPAVQRLFDVAGVRELMPFEREPG